MYWIIVSLLTACATATQDAWVKKHFSMLSSWYMLSYPLLYSLPLFSGYWFFIATPEIHPGFYSSFFMSLPINAAGFMLHMRAIKIAPLSLTLPYLSFTPLFMIATAAVFLDEYPNWWGIVGIVITCFGSYVLNLEPGKIGFTAPLRAIVGQVGARLMLLTAFLYSLGAVIGKKAIITSSPQFFIFSFFTTFNSGCILLFIAMGKIRLGEFKRYPAKGAVAGLLLFAHAFFHAFAITLTKAAYMISVKRLSVLIGIIYGGIIFREKNLLLRFLGALLMVMGATMIVLMGK